MFKRLTGLFLCLTLVFSCAVSFAAPVRDLKTMQVDADDSLRSLVSLYAGAALLRDVPALKEGEAPSAPFVEGVLLLGLNRIVLPRVDENPLDDVETVPQDVLSTYYEELFVSGAFVMPDSPSCPCITRNGDKLIFDFSQLQGDQTVGARIYSVTKEDSRIHVFADVYSTFYEGENAEDIPEDSITWETAMTLTLEKSQTSQFAYRLVSYETAPGYLDGALSEWRQVRGGSDHAYSALLPSILQFVETENSADLYRTADGSASLSIETLSGTRSEKLDYYLSLYQSAHADASLIVEADLGYFTGEAAGEYTLCIAPENAGYAYRIVLTFPAERQAEFSFYGEIIRNSFGGDGLADG